MDDSALSAQLRRVIREPASVHDNRSYRDVVVSLLDIYALHLAPLEETGDAVWWQHDPRISAAKIQLERRFRARLDGGVHPLPCDDAVDGMHRLMRDELVPPLYDWLRDTASRDELAHYIAVEGGPDADFDDLVALCQVGLSGLPKLTLAENYWDEMGRGSARRVHTELHRRMVEELAIESVPVDDLPVEALERKALNGYLATNRALQPEMLGGLGLIECQAGPRCRRVVGAMHRLAVPSGALPFYEEHATADPRHGKHWIDGAVAPLVAERPSWGPRILRGAQWRASVNQRFFAVMERRFATSSRRAA